MTASTSIDFTRPLFKLIRIHTSDDLSDAVEIAKNFMARSKLLITDETKAIFVAAIMHIAYTHEIALVTFVANFLSDDKFKEPIVSFADNFDSAAFQQQDAAQWFVLFANATSKVTAAHIKMALGVIKRVNREIVRSNNLANQVKEITLRNYHDYSLRSIISIDERILPGLFLLADRVFLNKIQSSIATEYMAWSRDIFVATAIRFEAKGRDSTFNDMWNHMHAQVGNGMQFLLSFEHDYAFNLPSTELWVNEFIQRVKKLSNDEANDILENAHNIFAVELCEINEGQQELCKRIQEGNIRDYKGPLLNLIRLNTIHDLDDAKLLSVNYLNDEEASDTKTIAFSRDGVQVEMSRDLFIATALIIAYSLPRATVQDMIDYISDPLWDNSLQMIYSFFNDLHNPGAFLQPVAYEWLQNYHKIIDDFCGPDKKSAEHDLSIVVLHARLHWEESLNFSALFLPKSPTAAVDDSTKGKVQIFNQTEVRNAIGALCRFTSEKRAGGERVLKQAAEHNGYRTIPDAIKAGEALEKAKLKFENLIEPISRLQADLVLSGAMSAEHFRITPLLLLGDPGLGKTYLATTLGKALDVPMEKISAGSAQSGFQLTGLTPGYANATPGVLFSLLAKSKSAAPIFVIDEVDKIRDSSCPFIPVLLDLFEPVTSKAMREDNLEITYDASRIICILTANDINAIPPPLLSRVEIFHIPRPAPEQRMRIIEAEAEMWREKTGKQIDFVDSQFQELADRVDIDMRKTVRMVKDGFVNAMMADSCIATLNFATSSDYRPGKDTNDYSRSTVGFLGLGTGR